MAVDYLSAMNVGSGLNVTQIVDALVDAEKAPREAQLNENIEEKTVSISAFAEVKQEFNTLKTNLATLGQFSGLQVQTIGPTGISTAISATVTDPSLVKPFDHNIVVNSIAQPQTISFSGYSAENATLDASNLAIDLGSWAVDPGGVYSFSANANVASKSIALDNTDTLATVRDKINQLNIGVSASIIKISDTNYSLSITSALGTKNQIRVQATSTSGAISNLSYDPATNGSGAANGGDAQKQVAAASDTSLTFNGVSVSRSSNQISDLVSGVKIDVKAVSTTSEKITASYDQTLSLDAMKLFVDELNTVTKNLISLSKTSLKEEDTGPLAGDTLVRSYRNKLRLMTTTPISGYGVDDIYLSNFGVMTNRDGSLSLDEAKFKSYFTAKPEQFSALTTSNVTTSSLSVAAEMTGSAWQPGTYQFNSVVRSATSVLSANEAVSQTFKSIDSAIGANDGQLSDSLEAYVAANAGGTWSVTGTDSALLSIDTDGIVTVTGGTDYETKTSYTFNVEYTVSGSEKFSEAVTLNINNLAERKYTLSNATVPTSVGAGDSFSITVDGQTITTAVIAADDDSYTLTKLITALNLANTSADGSFTEDSGSLVFTYNDAASVQTSALTTGLIYNPAVALGTVSELTPGAVTPRTIDFADKSDVAPALTSAVVSDIFKIDILYGGNNYVVSHTIDASDVSAIAVMSSASEKATYLAGKLDTAASTAASGLGVGINFTQSSGKLVGTASTAGTDYNGATISELQFSNDGGSSFVSIHSPISNVAGTSTAEVVKIEGPSLPENIKAGDKFSVTLDNNGSNITVTTAALTTAASLTAIKDALNTAHAAANGTFSVSGSDLLFTYNHNTGNISNTNDTGLTYIPAPGTITQSVAGVDHPALNAVTAVSHVAGAASATLDGADMTLENGIFKITSGNARGIHITASGNNSASIYVGKSLFDTLKDFSDSVVKTNSDIDKKVGRYNSDIADYNEQLTALETRMENERARYIEQFTAMETAVSSFKETGSIIDNLMESWKASLS
jgi:flagellar hook-associated protein 2